MADDGGKAFPLSREAEGWFEPGMTLRDYFAGQALAGLVATIPVSRKDDIFQGVQAGGIEAKIAYTIADAMLAERAR